MAVRDVAAWDAEPDVRALGPADWAALREARLRALLAAPDAFEETYEQALARAPDDWRALLERCASGSQAALAVLDGSGLAAMTWLALEDGAPPSARLSHMWVEHRARRLGLARVLLDAGERWAAGRGAAVVRLWVNPQNHAAARLYASAGYVPMGRAEPLRPGSSIVTVELARPVGR